MSGARAGWLGWVVAALALALAAWAWWPAPRGDVLGATLTAFERQNRLVVFTARLSPVVSADSESLLGMLKVKQVAVIPALVDYSLDLSAVGRDRLTWDAAARRLAVRLPPVVAGEPDLDESRAQYLREGVWIDRTTQDRLTRANTEAAARAARAEAANPLLTGMARDAAREAIRRNLAIPLQVAGFGDVTVDVRFDGEAAA
jgi:hypothetical protein